MFTTGISGNPEGRKVEAQVKRAARAESAKCVAALACVRDDQSAPPEIRATAALELLKLAAWRGRSRPASLAVA